MKMSETQERILVNKLIHVGEDQYGGHLTTKEILYLIQNYNIYISRFEIKKDKAGQTYGRDVTIRPDGVEYKEDLDKGRITSSWYYFRTRDKRLLSKLNRPSKGKGK